MLGIGSCSACGLGYLLVRGSKRKAASYGDTAEQVKHLGELLSAATDLSAGASNREQEQKNRNGVGTTPVPGPGVKRKVKGSVALTDESLYEVARQKLLKDGDAQGSGPDDESQQVESNSGRGATPDEVSHPNAVAGGGSNKVRGGASKKQRSKLRSDSTKLRSESRRKRKGSEPALEPEAEAEVEAGAEALSYV